MKIGFYACYMLCLMVLSCGNDKNATQDLSQDNSSKASVITPKAIENLDYTDYALSTESEEAVANWEKYQELTIQINYLKKADLSFFSGEKELLEKFIEELKAAIPKEFQTNSIISRTVVLETALLKLNENLSLQSTDYETKLSDIKDLLIAYSNLNYQMNKKLEGDFFDKIQPE